MSALDVLIMGPPGAGKGTQAERLIQRHGFQHVSTGDLLRESIEQGTSLGMEAKRFMDAGEYVPDEVIVGMLEQLVAALPHGTGVLFDGFPRTVAQASALDSMLDKLGRRVAAVLLIEVPDETLVERLGSRWLCRNCQRPYNSVTKPPLVAGVCDVCGGALYQRTDDKPEAIRTRLQAYAEQTTPVIEHYTEAGVVHRVNGDQAADAVAEALDQILAGVPAA